MSLRQEFSRRQLRPVKRVGALPSDDGDTLADRCPLLPEELDSKPTVLLLCQVLPRRNQRLRRAAE